MSPCQLPAGAVLAGSASGVAALVLTLLYQPLHQHGIGTRATTTTTRATCLSFRPQLSHS